MPELPEVETVKNSLKELILNKTIKEVKVHYSNMIKNIDPLVFCEKLKGQSFCSIERRGKFLLFVLNDYILVSHLRMEGKYFLKAIEDKGKHEHVIFYLENNESLRYNDTRKFGVMYLFETTNISDVEKVPPLSLLGYEPFNEKLNLEYLKEKWKNNKKPIKTSLLDQSVITGLGNIYADEVCFMSSIHPETKTNQLDDDELNKIIDSSKKVLEKAIKLGGTTIRSFVNSHAATGLFQNELLVHTKSNCPVCKSKIVKIKVNGRGTYYCNNCQKLKP